MTKATEATEATEAMEATETTEATSSSDWMIARSNMGYWTGLTYEKLPVRRAEFYPEGTLGSGCHKSSLSLKGSVEDLVMFLS